MPADKMPHETVAEKIVAKLPKAVRDGTQVEPGGGAYSLIKNGGRTVAVARAANVRVTFRHDGSADALASITKVVAKAAQSRAAASELQFD